MKHQAGLMLLMLLAMACKSKKNIATPQLPSEERTIAESILTRITAQPYLHLRGKGQYQDNTSSQNFRFEIRIQHEERLLVDISDPILGMRVARLYADKDTMLYINRLQKQFAAGGRTQMQQLLGMDIETDDLIRLIKALPVRWNAPWQGQPRESDMIHLYTIIPMNEMDKISGELFINGFDFKIRKQILSNTPFRLVTEYEYPHEASLIAPKNIILHLDGNGNFLKIQLSNEKIQYDPIEIKIPDVPNGYAPVPF